MDKSKSIGWCSLIIAVFLFAVMLVLGIQDFVNSQTKAVSDFVSSFSSLIIGVVSALIAVAISSYFFYHSKLKEYNDKYFSKCARYDHFIKQLSALNNSQVNNIIYQHIDTIESSELYLYDSSFIKVAELLSQCSKKERKRLLNNLKNQIRPTTLHRCSKPCMQPNCAGSFELAMYKGQSFRMKCPKCNTKYVAYVSMNNKIVLKPKPTSYKRLTYTNFYEDLHEYLVRIRALFSKEEIALISKTIVKLVNSNSAITLEQLKERLSKNMELRNTLDDVRKALRYLQILTVSKAFFIPFPSYTYPLNMKVDEASAYISYIKYVSFRILEDRQLIVNREIVKKLIRKLLPEDAISNERIDSVTRGILTHIGSVDKYHDFQEIEEKS